MRSLINHQSFCILKFAQSCLYDKHTCFTKGFLHARLAQTRLVSLSLGILIKPSLFIELFKNIFSSHQKRYLK